MSSDEGSAYSSGSEHEEVPKVATESKPKAGDKEKKTLLSVMDGIMSRPIDNESNPILAKREGRKKQIEEERIEHLVQKEIADMRKRRRERGHKRLDKPFTPQEVKYHKTALKGVLHLFTAIQARRAEVMGSGV